MDKFVVVLCLVFIGLAAGCSADTAKRTAYETLQNVRDQDCLKNIAMDCGKRVRYEDYERQRKALDPSK